jgi:hypothetical protein
MHDECEGQAARDQAEQFDEWRACEERVRRAWDVWLTAGRSDHALAYGAFVDALAEEEHAATQVAGMVSRNLSIGSTRARLASG